VKWLVVFERFSDEARAVVVFAHDEARELGHNYIGTEHLLLGLLRQQGVACEVLASLGVSLDAARDEVVRLVRPGSGAVSGQVPFTPRAKRVLELTLRAALGLGHQHIGTEHLLLGIADENEGVAAAALLRFRIDADQLREEVARRLGAQPPAPPPPGSASAASKSGIRLPPRAAEAIEARERGLLEERVRRELEGLTLYAEGVGAAENDPSRSTAAQRAYISGSLTTLHHLGLLNDHEYEDWVGRLLEKLPPGGPSGSFSQAE